MVSISVLLPVYNTKQKYLKESIYSILNQSFTDFELLIIDDGSTDRQTVNFLDNLNQLKTITPPFIRLIRNRHDFVASLNLGLKEASGKYIARIDSEDCMFPDRLKIQYETMEANPEITVCGSWMWILRNSPAEHPKNISQNFSRFIDNPLIKLLKNSIIDYPTAIIRKDFLEKYDLQYEYYSYAEGYKLWFEIAKRGGQFYTIPQPLLYHRISEEQVSNVYRNEQRETCLKIRKEIMNCLVNENGRTHEWDNVNMNNNKRIEISVIMPAYNVEKYVSEAINSILNQTFSNFELIIIDDCSTDSTPFILKKYESVKNLKIITNSKQLGNYRSRNCGLEIASGKYVAVMDADDITLPERLEKQYLFMEANPQFAAAGTDIVFFSENSFFQPFQRLRDPEEIKVALLQNNVCTHPTLILRNEFLKQHHIRYNENYYYSADYNLLVDISHIGKITNIPEFLLFYRLHYEQITSVANHEQQMYRDQIQLRQLSDFKLCPSGEEIIIHHHLMNAQPLLEKQLLQAEKWCNKLIETNHKLCLYNENFLFLFLEKRLLEVMQKRHINNDHTI